MAKKKPVANRKTEVQKDMVLVMSPSGRKTMWERSAYEAHKEKRNG